MLTGIELIATAVNKEDPHRYGRLAYRAIGHAALHLAPGGLLTKLLFHSAHNYAVAVAPTYAPLFPLAASFACFIKPSPASFTSALNLKPLPDPRPKLCFKLYNTPTLHHSASVSTPDPTVPCNAYKPGLFPYGPVIDEVYPVICAGCICNEYRSITTRQCLPRKEPNDLIMSHYEAYAEQLLKLYDPSEYATMSLDSWRARFPASHQVDIEDAADSLMYFPLEPRDYTCNSFVKQEKQLDPKLVS